MPEQTTASRSPDVRQAFLIEMYKVMWVNINRHLTTVWQAAGVLAGAFALFALVEKQTLSVDVATALIVLIAAWLVAHTYDANEWFNRNLVIAANIERQFLLPSDERDIHFFFTRHRSKSNLVDHLRVHRDFAIGIGLIVLGYHFLTRVVPGFRLALDAFEPQRAVPYVTAVVCAVWIVSFGRKTSRNYEEFLERSPGKPLSAEKPE